MRDIQVCVIYKYRLLCNTIIKVSYKNKHVTLHFDFWTMDDRLYKCPAVAEMVDRLGIDMGRKFGRGCAPLGTGSWVPSTTMWPGPRPTCVPSFILVYPTVYPQYINVTDRQTNRQTTKTDRQTDRQTDNGPIA